VKNRWPLRLGALLLLATAAGCASLTVQVDVLNPEVVEREVARRLLTEVLPPILARDEREVRAQVLEAQNSHFQFYQRLSEEYEKDAAATKDSVQSDALRMLAADLQSDFDTSWTPYYEEKTAALIALRRELEADAARLRAAPEDARKPICDAIVGRLGQWDATVQAIEKAIRDDLGDQIAIGQEGGGLSPAKADGLRAEAAAESKRARQLFESGGFLDSPYAYAVVAAQKNGWASKFDRAHAIGWFGNTDIAIKALAPGNFTVKGVSFNPSDVAVAVSKALTQAVILAAQIYGVPIPSPSATPTSGAGMAASSARIAPVQQTSHAAEARQRNHRDAARAIAEAIVAEAAPLSGADAAKRKSAIDAIAAAYAAQKSRLISEGSP
jgi:hypothetical protein